MEYVMDVFQLNRYAKCSNSIFAHFPGPEVMTSRPEVTTFWGRLGLFGDENSFK